MSKRFEDFMHDNNEEFNEIEPSADLWGKIEAQLNFWTRSRNNQKSGKQRLFRWASC
ncbi:hypothetical protein ACRQ5D_10445 [Mucilaginibacter sp. P25]|uniref:hypothetical protein n=1 Tax=unclassified Mucilaginibacter TaxID=2617802 RepID=UPI003D66F061